MVVVVVYSVIASLLIDAFESVSVLDGQYDFVAQFVVRVVRRQIEPVEAVDTNTPV